MTAQPPVRLVIADDNAIVRQGLVSLLDVHDTIDVVGEARDGEEVVRLVRELAPDVVLCDVRMPGLDGVGAAEQIARDVAVLMLTYSDDPDIIRTVMASGAKGYMVHGAHEPDEIVAAVLNASRGSTVLGPAATSALFAGISTTGAPSAPSSDVQVLSAREAEIMDRVAEGLTNREIARACFLAEKTVKNHLNRIFPKLGARTRAEAVGVWLRLHPPTETQAPAAR
jgi:DNA-binding NarL/FixJ family response regulator